MRTISSKKYANNVEDIVCDALSDAIQSAYCYLARELGFMPDYDERERHAIEIFDALYEDGTLAEMRDKVIELFEEHGMDVRPDGREW